MFQKCVLKRLSSSGIWYLHRDNKDSQHAKSCRHAVTLRNRLGAVAGLGVPLWAELKSEVRFYQESGTGEMIAVAVHCRANFVIKGNDSEDRSLILDAIELKPELWNVLPRNDNSEVHGLVNPLCVDAITEVENPQFDGKIYQIFDESIFVSGDLPNTMITNSGSFTKSIEFIPAELFDVVKDNFPNTIRVSVCEIDPEWVEHQKHKGQKNRPDWLRFPPPKGPKIGILTGNSPESGITLMEDILAVFRRKELFKITATDINMPEIMLYSCPALGLTMELVERERAVWVEVQEAIRHMIDAGCDLVTVACNTTVHFQNELQSICKKEGVRFISIVDACLDELKRIIGPQEINSGKSIGLLGIGPVISLDDGYSGYAKLQEIGHFDIVGSDATELAYEIKKLGDDEKLIKRVASRFRNQIKEDLADVNQVILALTEASIVYRAHKNAIKAELARDDLHIDFIDPINSLAKRLVYDYLTTGYRKSELVGLPGDYDISEILFDAVYSSE